jgi:hypothetical protein
MLRSEDSGVHYEAVGVIGNLVHSSQEIKQTVLQVRCVLCALCCALCAVRCVLCAVCLMCARLSDDRVFVCLGGGGGKGAWVLRRTL